MASVDASDARSIVDPGGTQEAPATVAAVAPTLASQNAPPQERGDDVDASLSTASPSSPQVSTGADDVAVSTAVETSSSGIGAVDLFPAPPRPSSASSPIPSPRPSLVGGATVPAVVKTNSSGGDASPSHVLSSDGRSGHPQVNDPTDQALIKTGSSDSGVVDIHGSDGTTSLRGASGVRRSQPPQDSSTVEQITVPATVDTGSSDTGAARVTAVPLNPLNTDRSATTGSSVAVDDSVIPAAVNASSVGPGAVDVDVRAPALGGSSSPRLSPPGNQATSVPAVEGSSTPRDSAGCVATDQLQEVAELLKHAGNLLSRIGITNAQHVHVRNSDCKCPTCGCACAQNPRSCPSISEDARAGSATAATDNPAPAEVTSGRGGAPENQAGDIQDPRPSGPPPKDPQDTQQPSSTAQQAPSGPQALPGQLTGWAAVEKALKEFDQQEIGGYKEDIDSLLTFTGLYSAVLTAFVIVSYPLLQDPNQASASMSMSTPSTPSVPSAFQPSISAIRINILWFASLVISLATASFAILVKQWLRSYLKFASASPQGQLRIRHFRRAGLQTWKVFGIASTLPLLLQVSLALFFAGLCIFTQDVYPAVGHITLPLVCAWLFFFVVVTISPSFTAQCPYTTPALAGITHTLRTQLYPVLSLAIIVHIPHGVAIALYWVFDFITDLLYVTPFKQAWQFFKHAVEHPPQFQLNLVEESDMIKDAQLDLKILASADALQADDRLLGTTIKSALEQSDANWVQLVEFAVQVIGNRVPIVDNEIDPKHIYDVYGTLSPMVQEVVNQIFRFHAASKLAETSTTSVEFPKNWKIITSWAFCTLIHIQSSDTYFLPLGLDANQSTRTRQQAGITTEWCLKVLQLAVTLYHTSGLMPSGLGRTGEYAPLQLTFQWALQTSKEDMPVQKTLVQWCLTFDYAIIWEIFDTVYTDENNTHQLSNIIHSIVDYNSSNFKSLKSIEILKLSLLSVRVMYGKIHNNLDSRPRWSFVEAAQWKRTFIWLADRLDDYRQMSSLRPSADELAALRQLARSAWREIPDPTEHSSQQALPLPDYFYLILWRTAGEDLSQIPSQCPQLLQIAHMSPVERSTIWRKGWDMANVYRNHPGDLYPPGVEDANGQGQEGTVTSTPLQGTQDPIPNDPQVDADEIGPSRGLQPRLPEDISDASHSESTARPKVGARAVSAAEQHSRTNSGPAGTIQLGQTPPAPHEIIHSTEDTIRSPGERLDDSHDGDGSKKLQPAGNPAKLAEGPENLAAIAAPQASEEGGATPSIAEGCTASMSLPADSRDEMLPAEARDDLQVTADGTQADTRLNHTTPLLRDDAVGEDDLQRIDNIAAAAGSSQTIQEMSGERDENHTRAEVEVDAGGEEQTAEAGARAVE